MDERTLDIITGNILNNFHEITYDLDEVVEIEKQHERRKMACEVREKIFQEIILKYSTLVWQLYKEIELNKENRPID